MANDQSVRPIAATVPAAATSQPRPSLEKLLRYRPPIGPNVNAIGQAASEALKLNTLAPTLQLVPPGTSGLTRVTVAEDLAPKQSLRAVFDALPGGVAATRGTQLLTNNMDSWNARWQLLEQAERTVDTTYFILNNDVYGYAYLGHLLKKAREGVDVRLMVDATGTPKFKATMMGQDYLQELVAHGVEAHVYHPLYKKLPKGGVLFWTAALISSNHDKILAADGRDAITGGRNLSKDYFTDPLDMPGVFRDTDQRIWDPAAAQSLVAAFDREWDPPGRTGIGLNHKIKADAFGNWRERDIELLGAYALMDEWIKGAPLEQSQKAGLRSSEETREAMATQLVAAAVARLPAEGVTRAPSSRELSSLHEMAIELVGYPEHRGSYHRYEPATNRVDGEVKILDRTSAEGTGLDEIGPAMIAMVDAAEDYIIIENPYVVLPKTAVDALERASKRGVDIYLGTNSPDSTDSAVTQAFFLTEWPKLKARIPTLRIFVATGERKLHAKSASADGKLTIVGTYNLDYISTKVNSEVVAATWSEELAALNRESYLTDQLDPANKVVEYEIERDEDGQPVYDALGQPEVAFGPRDHMSTTAYLSYLPLKELAKVSKWLPQMWGQRW